MAWSAGGDWLQILRHAPLSCGMHDHTPQISPLLVMPMLGLLSALCSLRGELVGEVGGVEGERDGARASVGTRAEYDRADESLRRMEAPGKRRARVPAPVCAALQQDQPQVRKKARA